MSQNSLGLIEMLTILGIGVVLVLWELFSLYRAARQKDRDASRRGADDADQDAR